jgi:diacylglycerol kinase (ATP)
VAVSIGNHTGVNDPQLRRPPTVAPLRRTRLWTSFHHAFEGIVHAARTQPNLRLHLIAAALVFAATLFLRLGRPYVIGIVIVIALVLAFELLNTALEAVVDLMTLAHHPLAKVAKDAAAGAVLVVAFAAVIVGYLTFYEGLAAGGDRVYRAALTMPANAVFVGLVVVGIATVAAKAKVGRGAPLRGGAVSGHAALAFAAAAFIALLGRSALLAGLAFFLALLVTQSRVESGIHSAREVFWGGLLGVTVSSALWVCLHYFANGL